MANNWNIMIDLETLSTHTNAAIIEIGLVTFDILTGEIGNKISIIISPSDWTNNQRHIDSSTLQWWLSQSDEVRNRFINPQETKNSLVMNLENALDYINKFIIYECGGCDDVVVWGNGSIFDITILQSAYEYFNKKTPWKHYNVKDVRTIVGLNPSIKQNTQRINDVPHSAVDDCIHQINYLTSTLRTLSLKNLVN